MLQFILHILGYDIWFYISHRFLHTPQFYFIHKKHHEKREPRWLDAYYGDPLESAIQGLGVLLPFAIMNCGLWQFLAAVAFTNIRGLARHDAHTAWLIGNHHVLHHRYARYNFGEYWLDRLVGTHLQDTDEIQYGIINI